MVEKQPLEHSQLQELALAAESYLNETALSHPELEKRIKEVVQLLDCEARKSYFGGQVELFGVQLQSLIRDPRYSLQSDLMMVDGRTAGTAYGFSVIDIENVNELLGSADDAEQLELLERFGAGLLGRYAVCHVVETNIYQSDAVGYVASIRIASRSVAPISGSELFYDDRFTVVSNPERQNEVLRILSTLPYASQSLLESIDVEIYQEGRDGLISLQRAAAKIRNLLAAETNPVTQKAVGDYLRFILDGFQNARYYFPAGLPTSLCADEQNHLLNCHFDSNCAYVATYEDVVIVPATTLKQHGYGDTDSPELFAMMGFMSDSGRKMLVAVPLEKLRHYAFESLGL